MTGWKKEWRIAVTRCNKAEPIICSNSGRGAKKKERSALSHYSSQYAKERVI